MPHLVLASFLWSLSFGLIKNQLAGLNPYLVSFVRLGISFLFFLPFLRRTPLRLASLLSFAGAIQFGLMYCLYIASFKYLSAHEIALLTITTPIMVVLLDTLLELRWDSLYWLSAGLAVLAAWILVSEDGSSVFAWKGVALVQGSNLAFAAGQLLYKRFELKTTQDQRHFAWMYFGALIPPVVFLLIDGIGAVTIPNLSGQWLSLLYLGLIPSGIGFFLWNKGVRQVNSGLAAVMNNLKIPLAILVSLIVFREDIKLTKLVASSLVFCLAWWVIHGNGLRKWLKTA